MKRALLTLAFTWAAFSICSAQQITMKKLLGGYQYFQNGKQISMGKALKIMEPNPEAYTIMRYARGNNSLATVLGATGGVLIGWPVGGALGGGEANWALAGVGAGVVAVAIPFSISANKKAKQAVDMYNASLDAASFRPYTPTVRMVSGRYGVGLLVAF